MPSIKIETNQNVILEWATATTFERIAAFFIDVFILFLYFFALTKFTSFEFLNVFNTEKNLILYEFLTNIFVYSPIFFYDLFFEVFNSGKTPGKMLLKIQVIKINGEPAGFQEYAVRWLMKPIDNYGNYIIIMLVSDVFPKELTNVLNVFLAIPIGIFAILSISINKNGQRIGDFLAGTAVVKRSSGFSLADTILKKTPSNYEVKYHNVLKLSDKDVRLIKETLEYYSKTKDTKYIKKLSDKAQEFLEIDYIDEPIVFLHRLMGDYNHLAMEENGRN